ncbi:hypothetical protein V9W64_10560 [Neisseria leonii]|uniref:Uncharacterized protein n=1 Tax=Neisseria leonii TaxID=2995413 RepID=A0A9X4E289_9NEIS|nr:hypothetical protein [Neisseria sp. 51.81]MDD9328235.1 hypothetical protein [Neisseria sp. 51.81]
MNPTEPDDSVVKLLNGYLAKLPQGSCVPIGKVLDGYAERVRLKYRLQHKDLGRLTVTVCRYSPRLTQTQSFTVKSDKWLGYHKEFGANLLTPRNLAVLSDTWSNLYLPAVRTNRPMSEWRRKPHLHQRLAGLLRQLYYEFFGYPERYLYKDPSKVEDIKP